MSETMLPSPEPAVVRATALSAAASGLFDVAIVGVLAWLVTSGKPWWVTTVAAVLLVVAWLGISFMRFAREIMLKAMVGPAKSWVEVNNTISAVLEDIGGDDYDFGSIFSDWDSGDET